MGIGGDGPLNQGHCFFGGSMRDWLNGILTFIGATSLTDDEYNSINFVGLEVLVYNQSAYDELTKVLSSRELVSNTQDRLTALFQAKGAEITPAQTGKSNILLGGRLEY